jgi:type I restriction enzyme M protein
MLDDIKKTLWATADEYKHLVLGLIFVKYISDTFAARRAEVALRLADPNDEYYYGEAAAEARTARAKSAPPWSRPTWSR